jgi:sulfur relay protein TusB/DsrH
VIILSDYNISKLGIASDMMKITADKRIILLSDAIYLFSETNEAINKMLKMGVKFIALEEDLNKRGINSNSLKVIIASYNELVEYLLEKQGGLINL